MATAAWEKVAARALWADEYPTDQDDMEPAGQFEVWCQRSPRTNLDVAAYRLHLELADGSAVEVPASRGDLLGIAHQVLAAALEGWPVELRNRAYSEVIAPGYYDCAAADEPSSPGDCATGVHQLFPHRAGGAK
ncbi:hypothetical protein [Corynebacterium sp. UMB2355A]|uniref:hypothetical protein n=1 Tax=Corynebacterium sp. UMB2355A TaxID=3081222 RepID=UPI0029FF40A0|nr:hypothetical protein [Corynebacterium sp. UMB2355A]WPJ92477.1 hypothetical protein R0V12_09420 [Corynebacterium sp. UMB2355A]